LNYDINDDNGYYLINENPEQKAEPMRIRRNVVSILLTTVRHIFVFTCFISISNSKLRSQYNRVLCYGDQGSPILPVAFIHCELKKNIKMFQSYLPHNQVGSDKIWYKFVIQ